jgi:hypothetical protein
MDLMQSPASFLYKLMTTTWTSQNTLHEAVVYNYTLIYRYSV